eukprot:1970654-Pyramimonas_sp.AAC.1
MSKQEIPIETIAKFKAAAILMVATNVNITQPRQQTQLTTQSGNPPERDLWSMCTRGQFVPRLLYVHAPRHEGLLHS